MHPVSHPVDIVAYTLTSSLGAGIAEMRESLRADRGGLSPEPWPDCEVPCHLGRIALPENSSVNPERFSRNNESIAWALKQDEFSGQVAQAISRHGAGRVGLVMGTSTSSIDRTESAYKSLDDDDRFAAAYQQPLTHNPHAPGDFAASELGLLGPRVTISAACASSAKVFATAQRWPQSRFG